MNASDRDPYPVSGRGSRASGLRAVLIALIVVLGGVALGMSAALIYLHSREPATTQDAAPVQAEPAASEEAADGTGTEISVDGSGKEEVAAAGQQEPAAQSAETAGTPAAEDGTPGEPGAEELRSAYEAYLQLLEQEQPSIDAYYWQRGYYGWGDMSPEKLARPVVLADFYGDGIPELLYLTEEEPGVIAGLRILTWEEGTLRTLYSDSWDYLVAGGVRYYFFQLKDSKDLWAHLSSGDEFWTWSYSRFEENADRTLERRVMLRKDREVDYSKREYTEVFTFTQEDREIGEQDFETALQALEEGTETVLMYSAGCGDFAEAFAARKACPAMSCEEAIAWLRQQLGQ